MQKLAYLIGNTNYYNEEKLENAKNDVIVMSERLEKCGFQVETFIDLEKEKFKTTVRKFELELYEYNVGLFYFAGHGFEMNGRNYLVPCDSNKYEDAIDITNLIEKMSKARDFTSIIILDCCRTDISKSRGNANIRSISRFEFKQGAFIAFATSSDSSASDGEGSNGLFTGVLSKYLLEEGLKIEELFKKIRSEVIERSDFKQIPCEYSSLVGDFYFVSPKESIKEIAKKLSENTYSDISKEVEKIWKEKEEEIRKNEHIDSKIDLLNCVLNEIDKLYFENKEGRIQ
ncbi:caspase family protein [Clostridium butyricum]|uniref:caspase family protein n=1 Tax=Clostridium butyricum TaxID=1492 RepID=UPI00374F6335